MNSNQRKVSRPWLTLVLLLVAFSLVYFLARDPPSSASSLRPAQASTRKPGFVPVAPEVPVVRTSAPKEPTELEPVPPKRPVVTEEVEVDSNGEADAEPEPEPVPPKRKGPKRPKLPPKPAKEEDDFVEEEEDPVAKAKEAVSTTHLRALTSIPHTVPPVLRNFECVVPENPDYKSQIGQDKFVYETFFKDPLKCGGVVLDIGANDGSKLSNSYFFERFLGWRSFCVEANPEVYDLLIKNRPGCHNFNVAISKEPMTLKFVKAGVLGGLLDTLDKSRVLRVAFKNNKQKMAENTIDVMSLTPNTIVDMFEVQTIDYLSVDVEGAELGVLTAFDFDRIYVKVVTVEANPNDKEKNLKVKELLLNSGFNLFKVIEFDEVYINKRFEKERA